MYMFMYMYYMYIITLFLTPLKIMKVQIPCGQSEKLSVRKTA